MLLFTIDNDENYLEYLSGSDNAFKKLGQSWTQDKNYNFANCDVEELDDCCTIHCLDDLLDKNNPDGILFDDVIDENGQQFKLSDDGVNAIKKLEPTDQQAVLRDLARSLGFLIVSK